MPAFLVDMDNRPGELARVTRSIADKGVNVAGGAGMTSGSSGRVLLIADDGAGLRSALGDAGCRFTEVELIETAVENRPGGIASVAQRLADAGVNVEAFVPTGMSGSNISVAFVTDNPAKAREALSGAGSAAG